MSTTAKAVAAKRNTADRCVCGHASHQHKDDFRAQYCLECACGGYVPRYRTGQRMVAARGERR
jgi:UDP-2,3-diacylglucosamine pyrophosphatase LpxH